MGLSESTKLKKRSGIETANLKRIIPYTHGRENTSKITVGCCRHYHKPIFSHCSLLVFICVALSVRQEPGANAFKRDKHQASSTINPEEMLSRIKFEHEEMKELREVETGRNYNKIKVTQDNLAHGFHEQEVTVPIKIHHETGESVLHGRHFLRKRPSKESALFDDRSRGRSWRSAGSFPEHNLDNTVQPAVANFSVNAFGETFYLHLTPYIRFISPTFTLHFKGNVTQDVDKAVEDAPRHCFYTGTVNARQEHTAVVSICGGLFGAFRTDEMDYLIQPHDLTPFTEAGRHEDPKHANEEMGAKSHRIYRRSTQRAAKKSAKLCAYTESGDDKKGQRAPDSTEHKLKSLSRRLVDRTRIALKRFKLRRFAERHMRYVALREKFGPNGRLPHRNDFLKSRRIRRSLEMELSLSEEDHREETKSQEIPSSRQKRYVSYPRYVETMVTADKGMLRAHGANLQHYVLTLMAIVHHVYLDASIGNQINIVFVKLIVIDDDSVRNGPSISQNAHECLRNFCQWQADENDPDDSHPNHHDAAVLITRQDICRSESACDTLGLAELGTMCDPLRSCSINEDNGLSTAFTIAHELGHEFNAPHDNNEKCLTAEGKPEGMHVMSPTLDHRSKPWSWSTCSARYITNFLDYGNGQCLLDEPPQRKLPLPIEEPGQIYDVNQQCSFVYGKGVTHCGFMTTCARLWCVSADRRHGCRTPHMPWADGTRCAPGKWCQRGHCVPETHDRRPRDGGWDEWTKFGDCSRTCGGGVRIAQRECNNPTPQNGGRYCVGKRKKFRSCNWEDCPEPCDFRAEQCKSYNWSKYNHHFIKGIPADAEWIPKYDGILLRDRCKLICQLKREDQYGAPWYVLKPKVVSGTPCGPDTNDICVEGICKRAGCDHVLNSNTKLDDCGVCGGDNSGCRAVKGVYNFVDKEGYNVVVEIPAGSTNILIEQRSFGYHTEDNNYLALKDSAGKFILNGNRNVVQFEQSVEKTASNGNGYNYRFDYTGTDNLLERINSTKAVLENITVLVLSAGSLMPPNIKYRYHIPLPEQITYSWDPYGPWSDCNHLCRGQTKRKVICVRSGDGQIVADHKCHTSNKPPYIVRSCNTFCEIKWRVKSQGCSARCGKGTLQFLHECVKLITSFYGQDSHVEILQDRECWTPKPGKSSVCYGDCLPTSWRYGNWSDCDRKCGGGTQTRKAVCKDSNDIIQLSAECDVRTRLISRMCNVFACPQWVTGDFSKCLTTCGTGIRRRHIWCRGPSGQVESDSVCNSRRKPPSTVKCHLAPCPTWKYEKWGKCSATCGEGVTMRIMRCTDYLGRHVDDEQCDKGLREKDTKFCSMSECSMPTFAPTSRSGRPIVSDRATPLAVPAMLDDLTSIEGNENRSSRRLLKTNGMQKDKNSVLPQVVQIASERDDKDAERASRHAEWRMGHWTECSSTCGGGRRERYVSCRDFSGYAVSEARCDYESRPLSEETCNTDLCVGEWRSGTWSECSTTCQAGIKTRYVRCMYNGRYEDSEEKCDINTKPDATQPCHALSNCSKAESVEESYTIVPKMLNVLPDENRILSSPRSAASNGIWRAGPWSQCSSSCGSGSKKRAVVCHGNCKSFPSPAAVQVCDAGPCPTWRSGQWSSCSVSCNRGVSTRNVQCVVADGSVTSDTRCNIMKRPADTTPCGTARCPGQIVYRWRSAPWSGCSVTCGRGTKIRQVACVDFEKNPVVDEMCSTLQRTKPSVIRKCRTRRRCPRWHAGKWNKCSLTCGSGVRVRGVNCKYKRKTISDDFCDNSTKPEDIETCDSTECIFHSWKTSSWSSCSSPCGAAIKRRHVSCVNVDGTASSESNCPAGTKPADQQRCQQEPCRVYWQVEAWSECSVTCGSGTEHRIVRCLYANGRTLTFPAASNCSEATRPDSVRRCNQNSCEANVQWRVGAWSECSATCGEGISERRVICFSRATGHEVLSGQCESTSSPSPDRVTQCNRAPCVPTSCRHAQLHYKTSTDGEYVLQIRGNRIQIYCKGMGSRYPTEYITLPAGKDENFSEIYRFSLNNSEICPHDGSRNDHCACTPNPQSGKTSFTKIRLEIRSMKVIIDDFAFASFEYGRPVPFAMAGDCYSKAGCPQGQFRVNLGESGLRVDTATRWISYGRSTVQRLQRSDDGLSVLGQCGGYCGQCRPDPTRGLILTNLPNR